MCVHARPQVSISNISAIYVAFEQLVDIDTESRTWQRPAKLKYLLSDFALFNDFFC